MHVKDLNSFPAFPLFPHAFFFLFLLYFREQFCVCLNFKMHNLFRCHKIKGWCRLHTGEMKGSTILFHILLMIQYIQIMANGRLRRAGVLLAENTAGTPSAYYDLICQEALHMK